MNCYFSALRYQISQDIGEISPTHKDSKIWSSAKALRVLCLQNKPVENNLLVHIYLQNFTPHIEKF